VESVSGQPSFQDLARTQEEDVELSSFMETKMALKLENVAVPGSKERLICNISTKIPRLFVTAAYRKQIFDTLHNLAHSGIKATIKMVSQRYV